jgi:F-type H+-transporting ATPase subunit epsilon
MAEGALELEILTPEGVALKETVQSITAPSVEGEFGVLPGHRPLLAALKTGIVSYSKDGTEVRVAVGRGFVEIYEDRAVVLTDNFIRKEDVDPVRTRLDLKDADEALDRLQGEAGSPEYLEMVRKELWAAARLTLYGDPPPPTVHTYSEVMEGSRFVGTDEEETETAEEPAGSTHE